MIASTLLYLIAACVLNRVPYAERKLDHSEKFGEGESVQICAQIMKDTGAHIEISSSKDQSLTFLVSGKQNDVLDARRKILGHFQTQVSSSSMCYRFWQMLVFIFKSKTLLMLKFCDTAKHDCFLKTKTSPTRIIQ